MRVKIKTASGSKQTLEQRSWAQLLSLEIQAKNITAIILKFSAPPQI